MLRILETGAGVGIANEMFNYEGASKFIYSTESYYSKHGFDNKFGANSARSVSAEHLQSILNSDEVIEDFDNEFYNCLIATTFQIGKDISNHGWLMIHTDSKTKYYHISLTDFFDRGRMIYKLAEICINLIHNQLIGENIEIDHEFNGIDIVLDENLKPCKEETLKFLDKSSEDTAILFRVDGVLDRIESIIRDTDNLILYKGSFNPVTNSHLEMVQKAEEQYDNYKTAFCISLNIFEKGEQEIENLLKRINYINALGYPVIVNKKGFFKDLNRVIRKKYNKNLIYVAGCDTMNRLVLDFINHPTDKFSLTIFENDFLYKKHKNIEFLIFNRDQTDWHPYVEKIPNIKYIKHEKTEISSTQVRKLMEERNYTEIKKLIPYVVFEQYKEDNL